MSIIRMYFTPAEATRPSHYREAWWEPHEFVLHHGKVGEVGKTTTEPVTEEDEAAGLLESFAAQCSNDGYQDAATVPRESFIVSIRTKSAAPSAVENSNADKFFSTLTGLLAWRGLGTVDAWQYNTTSASFEFGVHAIHRAKASSLVHDAIRQTDFRSDRMRIERN